MWLITKLREKLRLDVERVASIATSTRMPQRVPGMVETHELFPLGSRFEPEQAPSGLDFAYVDGRTHGRTW